LGDPVGLQDPGQDFRSGSGSFIDQNSNRNVGDQRVHACFHAGSLVFVLEVDDGFVFGEEVVHNRHHFIQEPSWVVSQIDNDPAWIFFADRFKFLFHFHGGSAAELHEFDDFNVFLIADGNGGDGDFVSGDGEFQGAASATD